MSRRDHGTHSNPGPSVAEVAAAFTTLWRAGRFQSAGDMYWANDIVSFEPDPSGDVAGRVCRGIAAVRARHQDWFATHGIEDLTIDGPFVTGDRFALFTDMVIAHAGRRTPHSEIAVFAVRDGKITEEIHFYE